jgi:alkanesulfonate monooxygenase SsuD/methylene tetrahydromethanopterin reductase-like flavin-dependent oxidoreductase (luciferase family)
VKLGIGLPNTLAPEVDRSLMLAWAKLADEAGFEVLGTIDKPNYDSWGPLSTLTFVAGVTERARLATTIMQLPNLNERMLAKQIATADRASGGRLIFGTAIGGRKDDFDVYGASFKGRAARFEQQVANLRETWDRARESDRDHGVFGPPPLQEPYVPIWIGGMSPPAVERGVRLGDGFIFGTTGSQMMAQVIPGIREMAGARGKDDFTVAGLAYGAIGDDPPKALEEASHHVLRYYGQLWTEPENLIHHGPPEVLAEAAAGYAEAGLDVLIFFMEIPDLAQVERLAEEVLPAYL